MINIHKLSDKELLAIKGLGPKSVEKIKNHKGEINSISELKGIVPSIDVNDAKLKEIAFSKLTATTKSTLPLIGDTPIPLKPYNVLGNLSVGMFTKYSFNLLFKEDELIGSTVYVGYETNLKKVRFKDYVIPPNKKVNVDISKRSFINDIFHIKLRKKNGDLFYSNKHKIKNGADESVSAKLPQSRLPLLLEVNATELNGLKINTELVYESSPSDTNSVGIKKSQKKYENEFQPRTGQDIDGIIVQILDGTKIIHSKSYFWKNIAEIKVAEDKKKKLIIDLPHKYIELAFKLKETNKSFTKTKDHLFDNYKIDLVPENKGQLEFHEFSQTIIVNKKIAVLKTRVLREPDKISLVVKNVKNERVKVLDPFDYPFTSSKKDYEISVNRDQRLDYTKRIGEYIYGQMPQKVTGHLVALNGIKRMGSIPIVIEVEEDDGRKFDLLFTRTDSSGRFSFEYPRKHYKSAIARVAIKKDQEKDAKTENKSIQLVKRKIRFVKKSGTSAVLVDEEKQFFPDHILLVIENMHQDDDCKCNDKECGITFDHEGEVLDEFSYYSAVRTTEPNIQKFTLLDEGEVKIGDIVKESNLTIDDGKLEKILNQSIHRSVLKKYLNPKKGFTTNSILRASRF